MGSLRTVYRYRSLRGDALGWQWELITQGVLYFPTPEELNDPFECYPPALRITEEGVRRQLRRTLTQQGVQAADLERTIQHFIGAQDLLDPASWQWFLQGIAEDAREVGVVSFAERFDSVHMWSIYADSHRGICIRFEMPEADDSGGALFKVRYVDEAPTWEIGGSIEEIVQLTFRTKARHWESEQEWRVLDSRRERQKIINPYPITGIILGARIHEAHAEIIKGWVRDSEQPIEIQRARLILDDRGYRLTFEPAEPPAPQRGKVFKRKT